MATLTSNPSLGRTHSRTARVEQKPNTQLISERDAMAHSFKASLITCQIGGLITAVAFMLLFALFTAAHALFPIQVIGSFLLGSEAVQYVNRIHLPAVITGVIIHQGIIALSLGLMFGAIAKQIPLTNYKSALGIGLLLGVVSMIGPYIVYPAIMISGHGADYWNANIPMAFSWITYLIMGASFALFPKFVQMLTAEKAQNEFQARVGSEV